MTQSASAAQPQNIGDMIYQLKELKAAKKDLDSKSSKLGSEIEELEFALIGSLEETGVTRTEAHGTTVAIVEKSLPSIVDPAAFSDYVVDTGYTHLFQRRLSQAAVQEILDSGEEIPGLGIFTKKTLSSRTK